MQWELKAAADALSKRLKSHAPQPVATLADSLPFDREKSLRAIRFLLDNDTRFRRLSDGMIAFSE